jgi:uncharacterized protein (TIGR03382 family)
MRVIGVGVLFLSIAGVAMAGTIAPEIDASSGMAALGLLCGGVLVLRARRKKQ